MHSLPYFWQYSLRVTDANEEFSFDEKIGNMISKKFYMENECNM